MSLALLLKAGVFALALITSAHAGAQTARGGAAAVDPSGAQPIDTRVGVFRPVPESDAAAASGAAAANAAAFGGLTKDYRVGANDLLEIEILDLDNFKRTVRVNAAGSITLPLIGATTVAGLTAQQVETHIAQRYGEKYLQNPQVSVFVKEFTTERITVDGAVTKPGIYPIAGQLTLLRALALAGGFGPIANSTEVMLFRVDEQGKRQVAVFDVDQIRAGKKDDPDLRGDDLIVVQRDATRRLLKDSVFRDIVDSINPFSIFSR
jgi:polysaccharide export outer membrane protein